MKKSFLYLCNIITELLLMWVTIGAVVALFCVPSWVND